MSKKNRKEETKRSFKTGNSRQDTLCPDAVLPEAANINCVQTATSIIQKEVWFCDWDHFAEHWKLVSIITIQCSQPSGSKVVWLHPRLAELNELIQLSKKKQFETRLDFKSVVTPAYKCKGIVPGKIQYLFDISRDAALCTCRQQVSTSSNP